MRDRGVHTTGWEQMVLGTGIDLVAVERIRRLIERHGQRFYGRVFTAGEIEYCAGHRDPAPHYAARFAAKEAFLKALGTGLSQGTSLKEIDVVRGELGNPQIVLHGRTAEIAEERGVRRLHLSLSHSSGYAVAQVVAEA